MPFHADLGMREEVLTDQLWERLEPLLPVHPRGFRYPGRKRADNRAALEGILYVIRTRISWNPLAELRGGQHLVFSQFRCHSTTCEPGTGSSGVVKITFEAVVDAPSRQA
ncbi:transposase [Amycolatopsis sp. DG1A-15b]|uniref:transposase n=1 Tax=Amycolatopsis sp. DG1A-15b TaxID=3052846 RepID=UPI00255B6798|nr:transposase [Amycolatopsis sp. DG1A-15b]WIX91313.1 transposase [Amycolatopsis sp. DG1A-15b]